MDALSNPCTPGAGTKPPALTGRDEQLAHFDLLLGRLGKGGPSEGSSLWRSTTYRQRRPHVRRESATEGAMRIARADAVAAALDAVPGAPVTTVDADTWDIPRWVVTLREPDKSPTPRLVRVVVDAESGQVASVSRT
jgi:hypothetical protein